MTTSNSLTKIAPALSKCQADAKDIKKDKQGYGYKYATLESILNIHRPILAKHGLSVVQTHGIRDNLITVTTRLLHESGEWIEDTGAVEFQNLKGMNNAQAVGAFITYLRRYQISAMLNITSDDDIDGELEPRAKKNKKEPIDRPLTLNETLKKLGIKDTKGFCLKYGIKNKEDAEEVMQDKEGFKILVEEFKSMKKEMLP